ncbi:MAG TPA: phosphoribosylformylglycinamidine synthase subunit PurS [Microbacteriaceae bacterium]|nr:phosphoribosylformylglycinamidine synthase subunit PurS [Microbacteriaceae bacterium]
MAKIIVNVMPKPVLLDPQGKAISQALERTGNFDFNDVRVGKTLELTVTGDANESVRARAEEVARELFINQELEYISSITIEEN